MYDSVVDALLENTSKIGQLVVVTPQGGGGTQLFGRGGGGGARLSPLETKVAESGADYLIVRAAPSDRVTDRYGEQANVVVAPAGRLPSGLQASRAQVGYGRGWGSASAWEGAGVRQPTTWPSSCQCVGMGGEFKVAIGRTVAGAACCGGSAEAARRCNTPPRLLRCRLTHRASCLPFVAPVPVGGRSGGPGHGPGPRQCSD